MIYLSNWDLIGGELKSGSTVKAGWVKLVTGNNLLRILSDKPYIRYSHWIPSANAGVDCIGDSCPICKINAEMKAAGQDRPYQSTKKFIMYVYNRITGKIELWDIGKTMMSNIFNEMNDRKDEGKSYSPVTFDLKIRKSDTGTTIKSVDEDIDPAILEELKSYPGIETVTLKLTAEQINELLGGKTLKELFEKDSESDGQVVLD